MRKSSKGFKRRPRQTLTEGQLTKSKRTIDDIANFFMEIREDDNIQRLLSKEKKTTCRLFTQYLTAHTEWTLRHLTKNTVEVHNLYIDQLKQQVAVDKNITKRKLAGTRADIQ